MTRWPLIGGTLRDPGIGYRASASGCELRRAERAATRRDRYLAEAFGALACRLVDRRLGAAARHQRVHGLHDEEEDRRCDRHEREHRVDEVAVREAAAV